MGIFQGKITVNFLRKEVSKIDRVGTAGGLVNAGF